MLCYTEKIRPAGVGFKCLPYLTTAVCHRDLFKFCFVLLRYFLHNVRNAEIFATSATMQQLYLNVSCLINLSVLRSRTFYCTLHSFSKSATIVASVDRGL